MERSIFMKNQDPKRIHSIRTRVYVMVLLSIILTAVVVICSITPKLRRGVESLNNNYMVDIATMSGYIIDTVKEKTGAQKALHPVSLESILKEVKVDGADSCYAYVVSDDGTMLYHPDEAKIGQQVENTAVKQVISEMKKGNVLHPDVITYNYHGIDKSAAYFINDEHDFIVVVTMDTKEQTAFITDIANYGMTIAFLIMLVMGTICYIVTYVMLKPINRMNKVIQKIGSLDLRVNEDLEKALAQKTEIGAMAKSITQLRDNLANIVLIIQEQTNEVYETASIVRTESESIAENTAQMEKSIDEIAQGAALQAEETQSATTNVILIGNMVEETKSETIVLKESAENMLKAEQEAVQIFNELNISNERMVLSIEEISKQTSTTNQCAKKIQQAISVITEIASETNLLSLNAFIEAARAGEAGRGFSIVAGQIKKLAEQSEKSAGQIDDILCALMLESEKSVNIMNDVKETCMNQNKSVELSQKAFKEIKTNIDEAMNSVESVSMKANKLEAARGRVIEVVQNLSAIAEENAAGVQETAASSIEVATAMENMNKSSNHLKAVADSLKESINRITIN